MEEKLTFEKVKETLPEGLDVKDVSVEQYREYKVNGEWHVIVDHVALVTRPGGTTHRIVCSNGVTWCMPANVPLRWLDKDISVPIKF